MKTTISLATSLLLALAAFSVSALGQDFTGKVETKYDTAKNETTLELTNLPMTGTHGNLSVANLSVSYDGKNVPKKFDDDVIFIVSVVNPKGHHYPDINDVAFMSGSKKIAKALLLNLDQREFETTSVLETIGTRMKLSEFRALASSTGDITFKIGETTFTMPASTMAYFGTFQKALAP